jgi:hypothetical protein
MSELYMQVSISHNSPSALRAVGRVSENVNNKRVNPDCRKTDCYVPLNLE